MMTFDKITLSNIRKETNSLGEADVPAHVLWGAQKHKRTAKDAGEWGNKRTI
jgi:hypothetical protein